MSGGTHAEGQVAVGDYILQIGSEHGGVVHLATPAQQPLVRPRPVPVFLRPLHTPGLLDREAEVRVASDDLQPGAPVDFYGQAGVGKTALLSHLAHHPVAASFPDGVIYLPVRRQPVEDLVQALFDAFYESDISFKPTAEQAQQALQDKRALILLDDVGLAPSEVRALVEAVPASGCLLASSEQCLRGMGQAIEVHGLPVDSALGLLEQALGRARFPGGATGCAGSVHRAQGPPSARHPGGCPGAGGRPLAGRSGPPGADPRTCGDAGDTERGIAPRTRRSASWPCWPP